MADFIRTVITGQSSDIRAPHQPEMHAVPTTEDTVIPWGGVALPLESFLATHFAFMGMTLSAKTLSIRMLMRAALIPDGRRLRHRALVYDPKLDFYPVLRGMGVPAELIHVLNPFDTRSSAWDIAADIKDPASARQFAALLAPLEQNSHQPFFSNAAQALLEAVINTLRVRAPGRWTLNDALEAFYSTDDLRALLSFTDDGRRAVERYLDGSSKTGADVMSTVDTKLMPFTTVARLWARADKQKRVSLTQWVTSDTPSILLLGRSDAYSEILDPINRALFKRAAQLITARSDENPVDKTWLIIDEARWAGELDGLDGVLLKGRSKGAHVVLGFQDIQGLRHVYGKERADELVGQCGNFAVMRLNNPETMSWAAEYFGKYEDYVRSFNWSSTSGGGGASSTQGEALNLQERWSILAQQFRCFAQPSRERGIEGAFAVPEKAWTGTVPPDFISRYLCQELKDAASRGFIPRDAADQDRSPWTAEFRNEIGLDKPSPQSTATKTPQLRGVER